MAKETFDDLEYLVFLTLKEFNFLCFKYHYYITGLYIRLKDETGILYKSKDFKREVSIDLDLNFFNIKIIDFKGLLGRERKVSNYDIIRHPNKQEIIKELNKNIETKQIHKVIKFYAGYIEDNLDEIVSGKKWF